MIRCLPSHIHWHTPCCTGSEAWLLHWSNSALAVGCSVPSETQWYHHNCTVIYIYNWVNHCTMEPMMESFKSSFRSFPHLQLLKPTTEMACNTPRREIESHTNWGRPIRAWSNPFGDLYGRGPPRGGKGTFTEEQVVRGGYAEFAKDNKNLAPEKCLCKVKSCNLSSHQLCGNVAYVALQVMTIPAINFGRALQPGSPVHLAPSISCACWCFDQGQGISVDCCGVTWSCKKYPKIQGLEASSHCWKIVWWFDVGNPRVCHQMPLGSCVRFWNFLLTEAIFSCPRVETTSRRQAGTGFQGINLLLPHTRTGFKDCDQGLTSLWAHFREDQLVPQETSWTKARYITSAMEIDRLPAGSKCSQADGKQTEQYIQHFQQLIVNQNHLPCWICWWVVFVVVLAVQLNGVWES